MMLQGATFHFIAIAHLPRSTEHGNYTLSTTATAMTNNKGQCISASQTVRPNNGNNRGGNKCSNQPWQQQRQLSTAAATKATVNRGGNKGNSQLVAGNKATVNWWQATK